MYLACVWTGELEELQFRASSLKEKLGLANDVSKKARLSVKIGKDSETETLCNC